MHDTAVKLKNLKKKFGDVTALDDINLEVKDGDFYFLLGPSGCGKTTLLKIIAGLELPTKGSVTIAGKDVTMVPANHRNTATIFQEWALFPHMNVYDNIAFGLRMMKVSRAEVKKKVSELLDLFRMAGFEERFPFQLSGGQQQRIAMARALAIEPDVLLLDEPLSNLDLTLRQQMRVELVRLHKEIQKTFVYVTHDQTEALSMATQIAVMSVGQIVQVGTPEEIYKSPVNEYVAKFIGEANELHGTVQKIDSQIIFKTDSGIKFHSNIKNQETLNSNKVVCIIRPEHIKILSESAPKPANYFDATIDNYSYLGKQIRLWVKLNPSGDILFMDIFAEELDEIRQGKPMTVGFDSMHTICFQGK
jgi:ABC-type Fe3+/spermidine/putrescine transport system ATPase subunit